MIRNVFVVIFLCAVIKESSTLMADRSQSNVETCGTAVAEMGLIVKGEDFSRGAYPWIVALMHTGYRPPKLFCGGTLISKSFVISAAHCIHRKSAESFFARDILASFGAHDLAYAYEDGKISLSPKKLYVHDDWNHLTASYDADISILQFEEGSIPFGSYIQPVCLWDPETPPSVTKGIVIGWGKTENPSVNNWPKLISAPMQSNELCFLEENELIDPSSVRTFCAGLKNGSGVCQGDSGSGLVMKYNNVYQLKGIVSTSLNKDGGCDVSKNAVYTDVPKFSKWIEKITKGTVAMTAQRFPPQRSGFQKVYCTFQTLESANLKKKVTTCVMSTAIDSSSCTLESQKYPTVEFFKFQSSRDIKFIPQLISARFPDLKEFQAISSGLTVVHDFNFKEMGKLRFLLLQDNKISTVDTGAFKDLVSLEQLVLRDNLILTLDEKLLKTMVSLKEIYIDKNQIKTLAPAMFTISGGKLWYVDLRENICINKFYRSKLDQLEADIIMKCIETARASATQDPTHIICTFVQASKYKTCVVNQKIDSDDFILASPVNASVEQFFIRENTDVERLPREIGEKFPNLKEFNIAFTSTAVIRSHYFKNMRNLQQLVLSINKIATIEPGAFDDLVSVIKVYLHNNQLETLHEKLFITMTNLEIIWLKNNKIKLLSPTTFKIPSGKLRYVNLEENVCQIGKYESKLSLYHLEYELSRKCTGSASEASTEDSKDIFCIFIFEENRHACLVSQAINSDDYILASPVNATVQLFYISSNEGAKHLPRNIGERFVNLEKVEARYCSLTIVRDFYFTNMRKLQYLALTSNKIATIEPDSFKDLVSVKRLWLRNNLLETLNEQILTTMINLELIDLVSNKITALSPETFTFSGGKLELIDLQLNSCVNKIYGSAGYGHDNLNLLEPELKANCTK